ncbi:MAG: rhomboid family intramembrane serine protease [Nitrosopumilus sp.]|nr:rhomboid family intramembrane serine protease [Nitrosopumilus sp.]MDA7943979.1 rhomboid family intramembrane serine protease [Nitrosopumilus sp.]MDA7953724.1 rhomboid family intramembrane serine protease [Nitrosopumilus sp.]MDA7958549.1 rhomboid family intramembrane serine protease [Nitrosopumilus sp.]MDA7960648.1 rhomboid family intramembrane serine protease [Nitrosopumilus sp.]
MLPLRDENPHPPGFRPVVTYGLIAANLIVFVMQIMYTGQFIEFGNERAAEMYYTWGAVPNCVTGGSYSDVQGFRIECPPNPLMTLLSSTFMHGGLMHLGGNMLFLWIFGDNIEQKFGKAKYLGIYLAWGIGAGLAHILAASDSVVPAVGASGAISGVLGAYLIMFPKHRIMTFLMLGFFWRMMHIQAKWFLPFWLIFQNLLPFFIGGFGVAGGGVAYLAHIGGFVIGLGTGYLYKKGHQSEYMYGTRYGYRPDDYR